MIVNVFSPALRGVSDFVFRANGRHRLPRPTAVHGALVDTQFRFCEPCGVETAVIVHPGGAVSCTEDHRVVDGDPT
ncbi:hypothetical protein [Streptomyces canus]|uniref:hypothetical protein n=1 Tax=Streptomyces canus TaxID=58343 RepID=UPI00386D90C5|nr:hypothetical protein OH824_14030 [Streptomyces canus]